MSGIGALPDHSEQAGSFFWQTVVVVSIFLGIVAYVVASKCSPQEAEGQAGSLAYP